MRRKSTIIHRIILFSILIATFLKAYPQQEELNQKNTSYLSIRSGLTVVYNTIDPEGLWGGGYRIFLEYQKEMKQNCLWGVSYESMVPFNAKEFEPFTHFLSVNGYYWLNLYKDRFYFIFGLGAGVVHHYENEKNALGVTANGSLLLSIRITKSIYFELPPLILMPPTRIYYSPLNFERNNNLLALPVFSFGIKIRI